MSLRYFKGLVVAFALAFAVPALAQTGSIDISKLTPEKLEQIQKIVGEDPKSTIATIAETVTPEKISNYAEVGKAVGQGLAATAKELGLAANNFAQTDVGKVALFLIVWKLALGEIVGGFFYSMLGVGWLIVVFVLWTRYFRQICLVELTEVEETVRYEGNTSIPVKTTKIHNFDIDDSSVNIARFLMFIVLVIACIPGFILL